LIERAMKRFPTLFISHGSPMHAVSAGAAGRAWTEIAHTMPRPKAIVVASAHWESSVPMASGSANPTTIHDFGGFPKELYELRYAAPGAPDLAARVVALLKDVDIAAGIDGSRGLDHGAWVPLRWMYPGADVPVVELSVQPHLGTSHHVRVGNALAPLADAGVLIIGSGHTTHNLRDWMTHRQQGETLPYARDFATWVHDRLAAADVDDLVDYRERAPGAMRAHPTEEHFLPLFVALGAAGHKARATRFFEGFEGASLSLDSYSFQGDSSAAH
jgi:4,5-DOPA dioxygenase extradiol